MSKSKQGSQWKLNREQGGRQSGHGGVIKVQFGRNKQRLPLTVTMDPNAKKLDEYNERLAHEDEAIFCTIAHKFALWLADKRAFYPAARPKVSTRPDRVFSLKIPRF